MSKAYRIYDQKGLYYLTITVVGWIDVFSRQRYRDIVIDSLKYCMENKGLELYAYVIITNHLHLITSTKDGEGQLSDIVRDFKKHTAKRI